MKINTEKDIIDTLRQFPTLKGYKARRLFDNRVLFRLLREGKISFNQDTEEFFVKGEKNEK